MSDTPQSRFSICRVIGTIGACTLIASAIAMGGSTGFFNLPSAMFTFGICFFLLLLSFGIEFLKFIPASFKCLMFSPMQSNPRYADIARHGSRYVIGGGTIGALIGMMQMLTNLQDPSMIGAGLAAALLTPFYALLASEIFFAVVYKAFSDPGSSGSDPLPARHVAIPLVVVGSMVGMFFVILIAISNMREVELIERIAIQEQTNR